MRELRYKISLGAEDGSVLAFRITALTPWQVYNVERFIDADVARAGGLGFWRRERLYMQDRLRQHIEGHVRMLHDDKLHWLDTRRWL